MRFIPQKILSELINYKKSIWLTRWNKSLISYLQLASRSWQTCLSVIAFLLNFHIDCNLYIHPHNSLKWRLRLHDLLYQQCNQEVTERKTQEHEKLEQKNYNKHWNISSHKQNYLGLHYGLTVTHRHTPITVGTCSWLAFFSSAIEVWGWNTCWVIKILSMMYPLLYKRVMLFESSFQPSLSLSTQTRTKAASC